jgi:hypothetical protein
MTGLLSPNSKKNAGKASSDISSGGGAAGR